MREIDLSVLRGVCQTPAYVAHEQGFFSDEGLSVRLNVEPTAWAVPEKLSRNQVQFAVLPWTRAAVPDPGGLVVVCGSGHEEAAIVVRAGLDPSEVRTVTVPVRGGMKDLTALALLESLGWQQVEIRRQPSGDGAIISLFGQGSDAASMVEPYATMMESLGVGTIVKRTGDVWPGAPGCSLTTTVGFRDSEPSVVDAIVRAFVRGASFVRDEPEETAGIAARHIGVHERFIADALRRNRPDVDAIRHDEAIRGVLSLMVELGYLDRVAPAFADLSFLDRATQSVS